jgi:hypothetical protein
MWVRLGRNAYTCTLNSVALDAALSDALMAEVNVSRSQTVEVEAPYVAWRLAAAALRKRAFGPRGGKVTTIPQGVHTALQVITKALNYMDAHPALRDVGTLGWASEEIPAWRTGDPEKPYSPHPIQGAKFVILTPDWVRVNQRKATRWIPRPSGQGRLAQEQLHLALWRDPVS